MRAGSGQTYATRDAARSDIFDYIEMLYNSKQRHSSNNQLSPVKYEERYQQRLLSVQRIDSDSLLSMDNTIKIRISGNLMNYVPTYY